MCSISRLRSVLLGPGRFCRRPSLALATTVTHAFSAGARLGMERVLDGGNRPVHPRHLGLGDAAHRLLRRDLRDILVQPRRAIRRDLMQCPNRLVGVREGVEIVTASSTSCDTMSRTWSARTMFWTTRSRTFGRTALTTTSLRNCMIAPSATGPCVPSASSVCVVRQGGQVTGPPRTEHRWCSVPGGATLALHPVTERPCCP